MNTYTPEAQAQAVRDRRVRIVTRLFPASPAVADLATNRGHVSEVATFHLYSLRAMLRRERQYLPAGQRHGAQGLLEAIDTELDRRRRA